MLLNIYKLALAGFTAFACFTGVSFVAFADAGFFVVAGSAVVAATTVLAIFAVGA